MIIKEIKPKEMIEKFKQTVNNKKSEQRKQISELIEKLKK
jgi:hypothetical protein